MDKTVLYLIIAIIILFIFYNYWYNKKELNNELFEDDINGTDEVNEDINDVDDTIDKLITEENEKYPITSPEIVNKREIKWLNKAPKNKYAHSSYVSGARGNSESILEAQDSYKSELAASINYDKMDCNDLFTGIDESDKYQPYSSTRTKPYTTKEIFNSGKLLPGEVKKDWFEVAPDPIKVRNRHLINIARPIGLDTIGSSNKNASWDLRGDVMNPKRIISPWMNSSIDPDIPTVGLCNDVSYLNK